VPSELPPAWTGIPSCAARSLRSFGPLLRLATWAEIRSRRWYEHEVFRKLAILGTEWSLNGPLRRHRLFACDFRALPAGIRANGGKIPFPSPASLQLTTTTPVALTGRKKRAPWPTRWRLSRRPGLRGTSRSSRGSGGMAGAWLGPVPARCFCVSPYLLDGHRHPVH
jgi:hypothetical protein